MYATGNCSTRKALIDAVCDFAVANAGFAKSQSRQVNVVDQYTNYQPAPVDVACLSKAGDHFWFASSTNGLPVLRGFHARNNDGANYGDVTGDRCPGEFLVQPCFPPFLSYHLFTEGNVVHVAAQMSSGGWIHFTFGSIVKYGSFVGGAFMLGMVTYYQRQPNTDDSNYQSDFFLTGNPTGASYFYANPISHMYLPFGSYKYGVPAQDPINPQSGFVPLKFLGCGLELGGSIIRDTPNQFNGRSMGLRMEVFAGDSTSIGGQTNLWRPLGYVPNLRFINVANLNAGDVVNTDWMVFPMQAKVGVQNSHVNTYQYGWAVRK